MIVEYNLVHHHINPFMSIRKNTNASMPYVRLQTQ